MHTASTGFSSSPHSSVNIMFPPQEVSASENPTPAPVAVALNTVSKQVKSNQNNPSQETPRSSTLPGHASKKGQRQKLHAVCMYVCRLVYICSSVDLFVALFMCVCTARVYRIFCHMYGLQVPEGEFRHQEVKPVKASALY